MIYIGTKNGNIHNVDDDGNMEELLKTSTPVTHILKHKREPRLLLLTDDFVLFQLKIHQDGSVTQLLKARLDVRTVTSTIEEKVIFHDIIWTPDGVLCAALGNSNVLCWDLEKMKVSISKFLQIRWVRIKAQFR